MGGSDIIGIIFAIVILGVFLMILNFSVMYTNDYSDDIGFDYFFPTILYEVTGMNIFGCIVVSILLFCVNYLFCGVVLIIYFIYWITHVGRKD